MHSTDYQSESGLKQLVRDHYCILKVGPWLTFGYREALFALSMIEEEIAGQRGLKTSNLRERNGTYDGRGSYVLAEVLSGG